MTERAETPERCPKCGAMKCGEYDFGDPCKVVDFCCDTRRQGNGEFQHTHKCRIRELESEVARLSGMEERLRKVIEGRMALRWDPQRCRFRSL